MVTWDGTFHTLFIDTSFLAVIGLFIVSQEISHCRALRTGLFVVQVKRRTTDNYTRKLTNTSVSCGGSGLWHSVEKLHAINILLL